MPSLPTCPCSRSWARTHPSSPADPGTHCPSGSLTNRKRKRLNTHTHTHICTQPWEHEHRFEHTQRHTREKNKQGQRAMSRSEFAVPTSMLRWSRVAATLCNPFVLLLFGVLRFLLCDRTVDTEAEEAASNRTMSGVHLAAASRDDTAPRDPVARDDALGWSLRRTFSAC